MNQEQMDFYRINGMGMAIFAHEKPDEMAVSDMMGKQLTWKQLNGQCNALARFFDSKKLPLESGISLICANRVEFLSVYFAAHRSGMRVTPMNWHLKASEIAYILDNCEAKIFFVDSRFEIESVAALRLLKEEGKSLPVLVSIGDEIMDIPSFDHIVSQYSHENLSSPVPGMQMLYTSGTTGKPKGVYRKAPPGGVLVETIVEQAAFEIGDKSLVTGPLYHAAPLSLNMVIPLANGVSSVLMDKWDPELTLELIERERITISHFVPTMFHRMLKLPEDIKKKYDISSMRTAVHGAAPCPIEIKNQMIEWFGPVLWEYYASTEGGGHYIGSQDWLTKPGTVGPPLQSLEMKVIDEQAAEVPSGEIGTVYFKAPEVGRFIYYKAPEKTQDAYLGDWYTMGDMGYKDDDGWLFLTGRSSELIISGGVNIYPAEIDAELIKHPQIADVACVGVPNEEFGEEVKALVVLEKGVQATQALSSDLIGWCRENLANYKCPRSIDFRSAILRMDTGKVQRSKHRAEFWPAD